MTEIPEELTIAETYLKEMSEAYDLKNFASNAWIASIRDVHDISATPDFGGENRSTVT